MAFSREAVSAVGKIGVALSVAGAMIAAGVMYADRVARSHEAERLLKGGVMVAATPTSASSSTRTNRRGGSSTSHMIQYAFVDSHGRRHEGAFSATVGEFIGLIDSQQPGTIRRQARISVVHDPANPALHSPKSKLERERTVDTFAVGLVGVLVLGGGLLITGLAYGFMKRRMAPAPVAAPDSRWSPSRAA